MENYKIGNYQGIKIECWSIRDLVGLHHLLQQEGCPLSENIFADSDKAIELDDVQRKISQKYHCDKKSSVDILLHVEQNSHSKLLLADAKYRVNNIANLDPKELQKKMSETRAIVQTDIPISSDLYILLAKKACSESKKNMIRRKFSNKPNYYFVDTITFHKMFEHQ